MAKKWDENISNIIHHSNRFFENESKEYIKKIYNKDGFKGLADYFWDKMYNARIDEKKLSHVEPFVGIDSVENARQEADILFSKYNFRLFIIAQTVIFSSLNKEPCKCQ